MLWRYRHVLAALCLAWAVVLVLPGEESARSAPPVVVATEDLPAGTRLSPGVLTTATMTTPPKNAPTMQDVVGERLAIGAPEGVPVARTMLVGPGVARGAPAGTVVTPVRLNDPVLLQLIEVGDRLDLYAGAPGSDLGAADAELITSGALVLSVLGQGQESKGLLDVSSTEATGAVVVAVTAEDASLLSGASGVSSFRAVVVPGG